MHNMAKNDKANLTTARNIARGQKSSLENAAQICELVIKFSAYFKGLKCAKIRIEIFKRSAVSKMRLINHLRFICPQHFEEV